MKKQDQICVFGRNSLELKLEGTDNQNKDHVKSLFNSLNEKYGEWN